MIEISNLNKYFNNSIILNQVSLSVDRGDVFCLLGPNGSGKTTMINCLLSLLKPQKGEIKLFGQEDIISAKKRIGVIMEEDGFYRDMSAEKNLKVVCLIKSVSLEVIPALLEKVGLTDQRKKRVKKLSQGMRKRLAIASSLIGDPELLIWDEPYNSLDPLGFQFMRNLIVELQSNGKTLFISTHLLDEVQKSGTKVGLIYNGQIKEVLKNQEISDKYKTMDNFFFSNMPAK